MNLKIILISLLAYTFSVAVLVALHFAISRDGLGNEFMVFGFPLLGVFAPLAFQASSDDLSFADVVLIAFGCFAISLMSIPLHYLAPERLLNPYSGPVSLLLQFPALCGLYLVYRFVFIPKRNAQNKHSDG